MQQPDASYGADSIAAPHRPRLKRRILDEMDPVSAPAIGAGRDLMGERGPIGGNTGIGGGTPKPPVPPPAAVTSAAPAPSGNAQHLLMQAVNDNLGTIRAAQGDAARKAAVESVLRGVNAEGVENIKGEKVRMGGKWIDLLQDVEGAAIPQWLVEEEQAAPQAGGGTGITRGMDPMQTGLIDQIRAAIMQLMGNGQQG